MSQCCILRNKNGRGVYANHVMGLGRIIMECSVLVLPADEIGDVLSRYTFQWMPSSMHALALGYGSLLNHSYTPNVMYQLLYRAKLIRVTAITTIYANEEITVNYNGDPDDKSPVGFKVK